LPKIIFTVTNDLNYDQRMDRISAAMARAGYEVLLIGRNRKDSLQLLPKSFRQKRLPCSFSSGFLFYAEYSIRLFFTLLFLEADIICAIDLDTILPVYLVTAIKQQKRVYDAHELFTEMKEVVTRPHIHKVWMAIERFAVPRFRNGYTVNDFIAGELLKRYGVHYAVTRNLPYRRLTEAADPNRERILICQGAVNEGRSFETLIPAMKDVNARLMIIGTGNFYKQAKELVRLHSLEDKVEFRGDLIPDELRICTPLAYIGITLFEKTGMNQYY
jgi:glycosyltransferase involved in cell wall biosynthesis